MQLANETASLASLTATKRRLRVHVL